MDFWLYVSKELKNQSSNEKINIRKKEEKSLFLKKSDIIKSLNKSSSQRKILSVKTSTLQFTLILSNRKDFLRKRES